MSVSIDYMRASNGSGEAVRSIVTGIRTIGSTTLSVDSLTNWPAYFIATSGTLLSDGTLDASTVTVFRGHKNVSQIIIDGYAPGYTDAGNTVGQVIVVKPSTYWADNLADILDETEDHLALGGLLGTIQKYTASTTWTKPTGLKYIIVEVQAGGGGGGGAATASAGQSSLGKPGGGGGYSRKKILAASLAATETVTVGAAGSGGAAGNNNGTAGGSSSFGAHATTTGGALGTGGASSSGTGASSGASGGTASSGDTNIPGQGANFSMRFTGAGVYGGAGGNSVLGFGGPATAAVGASDAVAGSAATGYGGGGSGGETSDSGTAKAGGAGSPGIVIVYEYF